jgi:hypothetical protein
VQQVAPPTNGLATASLVLGIIALVLFWTVWLGVLLGVLAVVFGAVGRSKASNGAPNKGMATAGLVLGILSIVGSILFVALFVSVVNNGSTTLKIDDLETEIASQLNTQLGITGNTVSCPDDDVKAEPGATFECTATLSTGDIVTIKVKQTDGDGNVNWTLVDPGGT